MEQTLGKRIMHHRKRLGMTQDQLAEQLGVTAQAVSKWENDQSCPDISMLPRLAGIFGITTDALLGTAPEAPVHEAEVVGTQPKKEESGWEVSWDSGRKGAFGFAILVLLVGVQLIAAKLLQRDISFWSALWPSALLIFGLSKLLSGFSFVSIGCALFGSYFLLDTWDLLPFTLGGELVFPIVLVVFGLSLLVDAFKKQKKPSFKFVHKGNNGGKMKDDLQIGSNSFEYSGSFGEAEQFISLPQLNHGKISTSFGEYTIDLSGVQSVSAQCSIDASCSFGELTLLVPRNYRVRTNSSTAFAEVETSGHAADEVDGDIYLKAHASFGEITIRYI